MSWRDYVLLREALETPVLRMTYCEGTLELSTPSRTHELRKSTAARLVEAYALLRDLPLIGYGSTTFRNDAEERGVEPDECYVFGDRRGAARPDLAIEVIWTSGGIDKLEG